MKNVLLATVALVGLMVANPAIAADVLYKAPPLKVPFYDWTGIYIGGHIGWAGVRSSSTVVTDPSGAFPPGFTICCNRDGFIGGAQIGFNWQAGHWVFGVEADWSRANSNRTVLSNSPVIPGVVRTTSADDNWYATVTGRVGYAQQGWLVYAKAGVAWYNDRDGVLLTGVPGVGTITFTGENETHVGWTAGAGIERALWGSWSAKIEYNYMDFGTERHSFTALSPAVAAGTTGSADIPHVVHAVKVGINYRFGGPIMAKY